MTKKNVLCKMVSQFVKFYIDRFGVCGLGDFC